MQIEMFDVVDTPVPPRYPHTDYSQFDWQRALRERRYASLQSDFISTVSTDTAVIAYRSGSSNKTDILGYMQAGAPIGVCVMDAFAPVRKLVARYASDGGKVFVDSGAFRVFMAGLNNPGVKPIDFDVVFSRYREILSDCDCPKNLLLVAPDAVGDQEQSYRLLLRYFDAVKSMIDSGAQLMIPMQKGTLSISEHYQRCVDLFGESFVVGLPSNAEALSREEVFSFLQTSTPSHVHFLGCSETMLVNEARFKSPDTLFTCDATQFRKHLGKGKLLTEMHSQIADEEVDTALLGSVAVMSGESWDETEILGDLSGFLDSGLSSRELNSFAKRLCIDVEELQELVAADDNDSLWEALDDYNMGYAVEVCRMWITNFVRGRLSPKIRTAVIAELATSNIL